MRRKRRLLRFRLPSRRLNPRRKSRRKARRKNPGTGLVRFNPRYKAVRRPAKRRPTKRRRSSSRRNPAMGTVVKKAFSMNNLMDLVGLAFGFIGGGMLGKQIKEPLAGLGGMDLSKFSGAVNILIGAFMATMIKQAIGKKAGLGLAASGVYDLLAENVPALNLPTLGIDLSNAQSYSPLYGNNNGLTALEQIPGDDQVTSAVVGLDLDLGYDIENDGVYP